MPLSPDKIKQELKARRLSMAAVGRRLRPQVSRTSVARVVDRVPGSGSKRIQDAVAHAIGKTRDEVFGKAA